MRPCRSKLELLFQLISRVSVNGVVDGFVANLLVGFVGAGCTALSVGEIWYGDQCQISICATKCHKTPLAWSLGAGLAVCLRDC